MSFRKKPDRYLYRVIRRLLLVILTGAVLAAGGAWLLLNQVFNGPSTAARDALTLSLLDSEHASWVPGLFLDESLLAEIRESADAALLGQVTDPALISMEPDAAQWQEHPDGIRVEQYRSGSFTAHILLVRDPGQVYLSHAPEGSTIASQLQTENAAAAVYASAGSSLLVSRGETLSGDAAQGGFAGFSRDNVLILAGSMTAQEAEALAIRDGCGCGMILILNGQINEGAYNANSGYSARTCIGQRADGSVVLLTIDGLSADSIGGSYRDCIDILYEYGCVNACSLDDVPAAMLYDGRMIHSDSLPRAESEVLPDFWMVRSGKEG